MRGKDEQQLDVFSYISPLNAVPPDDPGNPTVDVHGEKRSNETHASKTDPDAKMARKGKGKEAKLSYNGNLLVELTRNWSKSTATFQQCEKVTLHRGTWSRYPRP